MEEELKSLLAQAASGDESAFSVIAEQYAPLISALSSRFLPSFQALGESAAIGRQDLEQEARLALFRSVNSFDREQSGVTFGLYAQVCIRNSLISMLRRHKTQEKVRLREHPAEESVSDPLRQVAASENSERLLARIAEVLSPYETEIFHRFVGGDSVPIIAEALGRPVRSVHNAVYRIRCKVRELFDS